jgi:hypothetical protein
VLLDACSTVPDGRGNYRTAPDKLREQIRYLRKILGEERDARTRADTIIQLTQTNAALAARCSRARTPGEPVLAPRPLAEAQGDSESPKESLGGGGCLTNEP